MKKIMIALLSGLVLMASSSVALSQDSIPKELQISGKWIRQLKSPKQYRLYVAGSPDIPNASNGPSHGPLYLKPEHGMARLIADDVVLAKPALRGETYFVDRQFRLYMTDENGKVRLLNDRIYGDFSFSKDYSRMIVSRPVSYEDEEHTTTLELLDSRGNVIRELVPQGEHSMPRFTPDGKKVLYVSADTGIVSWYIVNVDGTNNRQLTNIGMRFIDDSFVPIMSTEEHAGFIDNTHFRYVEGEDIWVLDITNGKAYKEGTL